MPSFIPIFPLKLVTYPNEKVNLHVFEDRYKQLINECFEENKTFGIPVFMNGKVREYGTELELEAIRKTYEDGRMDVTTRGVRIYKIEKLYNPAPGKLYSAADVDFINNDTKSDFVTSLSIIERLEEMYQLLKIKREIPTDPYSLYSFDIGHHVGFSINQEYQLMTLKTEAERQAMILEHLTNIIPMIEEMERLRERVKLNGHFKNILPPDF
jgi:hypothetical protein